MPLYLNLPVPAPKEKLKKLLGWKPEVGFEEAAKRYFEYQKEVGGLK